MSGSDVWVFAWAFGFGGWVLKFAFGSGVWVFSRGVGSNIKVFSGLTGWVPGCFAGSFWCVADVLRGWVGSLVGLSQGGWVGRG